MLKNVVTLKSGSEVIQGHWKWYHSIDWYGFLLVYYSNFVPKVEILELWPWHSGYGSFKVIGTDTYRSAIYDFLLTFHSNYGPVSYRFRDKRRFQSKISNFPHPVYFTSPLTGFPLELGIGARDETTRMMGLPNCRKSFQIVFRPFKHNSGVWRTDRRTDRHHKTAKTALCMCEDENCS